MIKLKKNWRELIATPPAEKKRRWDKPEEQIILPAKATALSEFIHELETNRGFKLAVIAEGGKKFEGWSSSTLRTNFARKWQNHQYNNTIIEYRYVDYHISHRITVAPSTRVAEKIVTECNLAVRDQFYNEPPIIVARCRRTVWLYVQRRHLRGMEEMMPTVFETVLNIYKNLSY